MSLLVLKIVMAPLLLAVCSYAAWRWGAAVGGWLLGLPLISGPVSLLLLLEHGPGFAESAARATLLGLLATAAFCAWYALLARRTRWWLTLPLAYSACLAVAWALMFVDLPVAWAVALVLTVVATLSAAVRPPQACGPVRKPGGAALAAKMIAASAVVVGITTGAGYLGPHLAGLLAPLPVLLAFMTACSHRSSGHDAVRGLLRGALSGTLGGVAFFSVVALGLGVVAPALVYAVALLFALAAAGIAMRLSSVTVTLARPSDMARRFATEMRRERHLPRVRMPRVRLHRPAFLWMLRG